VDAVLDTNGAGDTFATAYALALAWRLSDPGYVASWAASRAVQQPQVSMLHCASLVSLWPCGDHAGPCPLRFFAVL
jgi:sugar/nucleoside kinase (ribokinase family)